MKIYALLSGFLLSFAAFAPACTCQQCPPTRERKAWSDLTCTEQDQVLEAMQRLKDSGIYDEFVRTHIRWDAQSHGVAEFLPWHRWFIWQFETAMRAVLASDPCITLPYWDWERESGREMRSDVIRSFAGMVGRDRRNGRCNWQATTGGCLVRDYDSSFRFWSQRRVVAMIARFRQYADDFPNNPRRSNGFRAELEGGPHAAPHNFLGGQMVDLNSPNDPLFWLHHANVDRLWAIWQDYNGHSRLDDSDFFAPIHYEGRLLDQPMPFNNGGWDFRLEGRRRFPTPREVLSNSGIAIQVRYITHNIMPGHTPNRRWFAGRTRFFTGCRRNRLLEEDENNESDTDKKRNLRPAVLFSDDNEDTVYNRTADTNGTNGRTIGATTTVTSLNDFNINNQQGNGGLRKKFSQFSRNKACESLNPFDDPIDHERWNELCQQYLENSADGGRINIINDKGNDESIRTMVQDLTVTMALEECQALDHPKSASQKWIENMHMMNEEVTFECFHLPNEDESDEEEGETGDD